MSRHVAALAVGFLLDCALGDPPTWPHPVKLVGKQIQLEEGLLRTHVVEAAEELGDAWPLSREQTERLAGAVLAADVALVSPLAAYALLRLCDRVHPALSFAVECALCYQLLAARSLSDAAMAVYEPLAAGQVEDARAALAQIVGRDVDQLDEAGIARATVETIAENTSDGVVAPLLYQAVGGAPAAMLYKAVNTLDSMVGYKNERYLNLGRAGARLDDLLNLVPARVTGVLMCAAAPLVGLSGSDAWRVFKRDRRNHPSPNSAHGEAACAGALGLQLGGPSRYAGKLVEKPPIGDANHPVTAEDIPRAINLMKATAALTVGAIALCQLIR